MILFWNWFVKLTGWPVQLLCFRTKVLYEDRKVQGILPNISVGGNITVSILKNLLSKIGFVQTDREEKIADQQEGNGEKSR